MREITSRSLKGSFGKYANFMTPYWIGYFQCGSYQVELTWSGGNFNPFTGHSLFGVTVMLDGVKSDKSTCCDSRQDADEYMKELEQEVLENGSTR